MRRVIQAVFGFLITVAPRRHRLTLSPEGIGQSQQCVGIVADLEAGHPAAGIPEFGPAERFGGSVLRRCPLQLNEPGRLGSDVRLRPRLAHPLAELRAAQA